MQNSQTASQCGCNRCKPGFSSPMTLQRYCRRCKHWFNEACVAALGREIGKNIKAGLPSAYSDIDFDPQFLSLLTMPIRQGGSCGIVGNGLIITRAITLIEEARKIGRLPEGWMDTMQKHMQSVVDEMTPRYYCLTCLPMSVI